MYIPRQRQDSLLFEGPPSFQFTDVAQQPFESTLYQRGPRSKTNETSSSTNEMPGSAAFVAVTVTCLFFLALILGIAMYKKFNCGDDDDSDSSSSISDSGAWRIEDPESAAATIAARHRKRLKKLEQVAPAQSLGEWRAEKLTTHVQTFATITTKLI
ncbi:uncharacterized protein Z518_08539 [Rhinocladiella mackenziei CBS 650.93]|uniref:Uncharacterized protein n=1 Tax=Rhinocladiella mackenziei CBS 650.93 TaxID=1442369 RepID=A0A0D2GWK0_9EURO|nr:uncharacterized protein Z518_08539 [Rhinocladiella mackenziei CBS 650.93]KIX02598.1 hypothetical protein Z518_08539 [Rhinocladiella mackenziei CBS 650.93]